MPIHNSWPIEFAMLQLKEGRERESVTEGPVFQSRAREKNIWPSFYLVGAMKCGTSSLYSHLKRHPMIFLPEMKEPHYFLSHLTSPRGNGCMTTDENCIGDEQKYHNLYRDADNFAAVGDASTSYLCDANAAINIYKVQPHARIIIMLRDPIQRAHSHYQMDLQMGKEGLPLLEALERDYAAQVKGWGITHLYVDAGLYASQVARYFNVFGRERVLVLLADELRNDPRSALLNVTRHLRVEPLRFDSVEHSRSFNAYRRPKYPRLQRFISKSRIGRFVPRNLRRSLGLNALLFDTRKPLLDEQSRRYLQSIFTPDLFCLEELLGRKLPELRKSWT